MFMNLDHILYKSRKNTELHANTGTRMYGYTLFFARTVWLELFCLILLVFLLALVYFACVKALQVLLRGFTGGSELAIVGPTLTIAILFQPLRRRIQQVIDRRFYRSKYDAVHTLESFSEAMSEEVDLDQLTDRL
jgi:hypothetical protein